MKKRSQTSRLKPSEKGSQCIQTLDAIRRVEKQTELVEFRTYPSIKRYLQNLAQKKEMALNRFMQWQVEEAYKQITEEKKRL